MKKDVSKSSATEESLCGVWIDGDGTAHLAIRTDKAGREERQEAFKPFAWVHEGLDLPETEGISVEKLRGKGAFDRMVFGENAGVLEGFLKTIKDEKKFAGKGVDAIRPMEGQFLLQQKRRYFEGMGFHDLKRCQLDIETSASEGQFSNAAKAGDRVLAIGLRFGKKERMLVLEEMSDAAEKKLLEQLNEVLAEEDPDTIEGHNIFKFDLDFLRQRARRHKVPCLWGRFGQAASFRRSRLKVAEQLIDFPRCDLPGRTVVDTYLLVQLYDITTREMSSYGLKDVAVYFGVTKEDSKRTYIKGTEIQHVFKEDRERFLSYLGDDLRETAGIGDVLLPTYFEQAKNFPMLFQDVMLRGTAVKVDLLFLEAYYHAGQSCPDAPEVKSFEGGYTRSFADGVYRDVLHFDVASLYPSLLMQIGENPKGDELGVFVDLLKSLREYRLRYKQLAKTAETEELRAEYQARQTSFKILINSFYGYLGFPGARFADSDLAAEVTRRGREILQSLVEKFEEEGCDVLEVDTDGLYVSSEKYFRRPESLLKKVASVMPEGIDLEWDGSYETMFCYKAKNYALYDGERIIIRGSALRSRGMEPYLKKLTDQLIAFLLGKEKKSPLLLMREYEDAIREGSMPVEELAKSEVLGMSPERYEQFVAEGGKPRRAAGEVSLKMHPRPSMGDRVSYYLVPKEKGQTSDWQRAKPVAEYDSKTAPYDARQYEKKMRDWLNRYETFLAGDDAQVPEEGGRPGELF